MKKILAVLALIPALAFGQSYPSPTYNNLTVNGTATLPHAAITGGTISGLSAPLPVASGGTGVVTATGSGSAVLSTTPVLAWTPANTTQGNTPAVTINRTANYTGGAFGQINPALMVNLTSGANTTDFEWGIYSLVQNNSLITATPSQSPQNVAVGGYIDKGVFGNTNIGPSWGANFACSDVSAEPNPKAGCIGAELNVFANPNGSLTDNNQQRIGLAIATGSAAGVHIGSGILFQPGAGSIIDAGLRFQGTTSNGSYGNIIDAIGDTPTYTNLIVANNYNVGYNGVVQSTQQNIQQAGSSIGIVENVAAGNATGIQVQVGGSLRWNFLPADGSTETGSNAGNNFVISRFSDAGGFLGVPFTINRASGLVTVANGLQLPVTTVASLPTCGAGLKGTMYAVSDATTPTYNGSLTGGGGVSVPVYCNGTAWTSH